MSLPRLFLLCNFKVPRRIRVKLNQISYSIIVLLSIQSLITLSNVFLLIARWILKRIITTIVRLCGFTSKYRNSDRYLDLLSFAVYLSSLSQSPRSRWQLSKEIRLSYPPELRIFPVKSTSELLCCKYWKVGLIE